MDEFTSRSKEILERSPFYQRLVSVVGANPQTWETWRDVTPVSVTYFKSAPVVGSRFWESSGTSGNKSRTPVDLESYHQGIDQSWKVGPEIHPVSIALIPSRYDWPNSSLAEMFSYHIESRSEVLRGVEVLTSDGFFRLDQKFIYQYLKRTDDPVTLYGTSYAFAQFFEWVEENRCDDVLVLPSGSNLIDTGGYKGRVTPLTRREFLEKCSRLLGLPEESCWNEYGMSEMSSHFWQRGEGFHVGLSSHLVGQTLDPISLQPSISGLLTFYDLYNSNFVGLVTQDVGSIQVDRDYTYLQVGGRVPLSAPKGCSLISEELMSS